MFGLPEGETNEGNAVQRETLWKQWVQRNHRRGGNLPPATLQIQPVWLYGATQYTVHPM